MPILSTAAERPAPWLSLAIAQGESRNQTNIGLKILPEFPITHRNVKLVFLSLADTFRLRHIGSDKFKRNPGTHFERISMKFGNTTLTTNIRGAELKIPNETKMDYAEFLDVENFALATFGEALSLTKEFLIADAVFNTTNFGAATNSAVAYTAANSATNSFFADMIGRIRAQRTLGENPDTIVMSGPVYERIRQSAGVLAYLRGVLVGITEISLNAIQQALAEFGIKQVLVGDSYQNTAVEGSTTLSQIWSNTYIWVGKAGLSPVDNSINPGVPTISGAGISVVWEGYEDGGVPTTDSNVKTYEGGNYVEVYPDKPTESWIYRIKMSFNPTVTNARAGSLLATQYS